MPYGNRSEKVIYQFLKEAIEYLFKRNCQLIVVACNTASAAALRRIQKEYLPKYYPNRRVLGVIRPTVEVASEIPKIERVGVLATQSTVASGAYVRELKKVNRNIKVYQQAAPLLVPLIENNGIKWIKPILEDYLKSLLDKKVQAVIFGCTHYPLLKKMARKILGKEIPLISQDEVIPKKLCWYLAHHPEISQRLSKNGKRQFLVTDLTEVYSKIATRLFGDKVELKLIRI